MEGEEEKSIHIILRVNSWQVTILIAKLGQKA